MPDDITELSGDAAYLAALQTERAYNVQLGKPTDGIDVEIERVRNVMAGLETTDGAPVKGRRRN